MVLKNSMKVLFLAAEANPFAKAGGDAKGAKIFQASRSLESAPIKGNSQDFSWKKSAAVYADLYDQLVEAHP
jgi:glycogen synthase